MGLGAGVIMDLFFEPDHASDARHTWTFQFGCQCWFRYKMSVHHPFGFNWDPDWKVLVYIYIYIMQLVETFCNKDNISRDLLLFLGIVTTYMKL